MIPFSATGAEKRAAHADHGGPVARRQHVIPGHAHGKLLHVHPIHGLLPELLKQGALKLLRLSDCNYSYAMLDKTVDVVNAYIGYTVKITIFDANGEIVSEALASANSLEKKFADKGLSGDSMLVGMATKRALVQAVKAILG